ncbi:MAG TPA: hypothetical protein VKY59_14685, partial [Spirillospora sp.]|nr:hypothetical protein [Spirillospora sp.]
SLGRQAGNAMLLPPFLKDCFVNIASGDHFSVFGSSPAGHMDASDATNPDDTYFQRGHASISLLVSVVKPYLTAGLLAAIDAFQAQNTDSQFFAIPFSCLRDKSARSGNFSFLLVV